jgi:hypothetical protein
MESNSTPAATPKWMWRTGWTLTALISAMLVMGGMTALTRQQTAIDGMLEYGYPDGAVQILGAIQVACALLYFVPQTSVLGAILVTAWLGGAVATHVAADESSWFIAVVVGVLAWGGLFLRDPRIRALIPLRKPV